MFFDFIIEFEPAFMVFLYIDYIAKNKTINERRKTYEKITLAHKKH